jgi:hypothetical protein
VALDGALNFGGGDLIGQSITADEQGAFGVEGDALDLDEVGVVRFVLLGADVAEDLIAARMAHGFSFADLAFIFALADGGMIVRDLANLAAAEMVETRIAHVADDGRSIVEHGHGEHAGHALPFGIGLRSFEDFIIGDGDGFADALFGGASLALKAGTEALDGNGRGFFAGSLTADAIDDEEDAAVGVNVEGVLIVSADAAGVGAAGEFEGGLHHGNPVWREHVKKKPL